ncbi:hypothetical protein, partial [Methermicoccus shengliensis]|nr:hypothetical protein [Methermicoccus shengliensis]
FQIPLNDSYVGIVGPSMKLEQCILELVSRLDDDIPLREFFVGNTFSDLFKEHRDFHTFVSSKQIFPAVYLQNSGHDTLDFFAGMLQGANAVFQEKLSRNLEDVCNKAVDIGIFEPQTYIDEVNGKLHLVLGKDDNGNPHETRGIFYKISDDLYELWIKPEYIGKMLEVWVYTLLKKHLKQLNVLPNVSVRKKPHTVPKSAKEITPEEASYVLTEIDCMIMDDGGVLGIIECKMKDVGWEDVLKFYGALKFLNAHFGVIVVGRGETFKTDMEFEEIKIIPNAVKRQDFPEILIKWVDRWVAKES